jgi:hypothetical protein
MGPKDAHYASGIINKKKSLVGPRPKSKRIYQSPQAILHYPNIQYIGHKPTPRAHNAGHNVGHKPVPKAPEPSTRSQMRSPQWVPCKAKTKYPSTKP